MTPVRQAQMGNAATQQPDHHGFDDSEGEQGRHGGIDGVAAGQQHLAAGGRGEGMVGHHHPRP